MFKTMTDLINCIWVKGQDFIFEKLENIEGKVENVGNHHFLFIQNVFRGFLSQSLYSEPLSSVGSVVDLRTGCCWFDPRLGQYSFRGLMIFIATGFIAVSVPSNVLIMVM